MAIKVLFLDRDGTLNEEPADFQVDSLEKIRLVPGVIPALLELAKHGYRFVMVTNQDGLGTDAFPQGQFDACQTHLLALLESQGISFDEILICPHLPEDSCECRKPRTGLLTRYLASHDIDLAASAVIGDTFPPERQGGSLGFIGAVFGLAFLIGPIHPYYWPRP